MFYYTFENVIMLKKNTFKNSTFWYMEDLLFN
jgi:hypothetical protein